MAAGKGQYSPTDGGRAALTHNQPETSYLKQPPWAPQLGAAQRQSSALAGRVAGMEEAVLWKLSRQALHVRLWDVPHRKGTVNQDEDVHAV